MSSRVGHAPKLAGANQQGTMSAINRLRLMENVPEDMQLGVDFPMLCDNCLGDSRFIRMARLSIFTACKLTGRPFQQFQWRPARGLPQRETIACYEVCAEKNICQCCLNDLDFNIPFALREAFELSQRSASGGTERPVSEVNQNYHFNQMLAERATNSNLASVAPMYRLLNSVANASGETDKLSLPELCSTWLKGSCTLVRCPYRPCCGAFTFPELASTFPDEMASLVAEIREKGPSSVRLKNRVVQRVLFDAAREAAHAKTVKAMEPPTDQSITTLFLSRVPNGQSASSIRAAFALFGEISSVTLPPDKPNAFVQFTHREDAERCITELQGKVTLGQSQVRMGWAGKRSDNGSSSTQSNNSIAAFPSIVPQQPTSEMEVDTKEPSVEVQKLKVLIPHAISIPHVFPGVPLPYGFSLGERLPDPPKGLLDCYADLPGFNKLKLPEQKVQVSVKPIDASLFYPSLNRRALEGNLVLF